MKKMDPEETNLIKWSEFSDQQQMDWIDIYQNWLNTSFFKNCLKNNDFKMDCIDCSDVFIIVEIVIDQNGKIADLKEIEEHIDCPQKTPEQIENLKACIRTTFSQVVFPESLRRIKYRTVLGEESMC